MVHPELNTEKDHKGENDGGSGSTPEVFERPKGLKGVSIRTLLPRSVVLRQPEFWLLATIFQVAMLGLICFMSSGLSLNRTK